MIKEDIARLLNMAAESAQTRGLLPPFALPEIPVERPARPSYGDYASSLPLRLARTVGVGPLSIAQVLIDELPPSTPFSRIEAAPPGFINFTLSDQWLAEQVDCIVQLESSYGAVDIGRSRSVQVEFISANPTGPLTAASGRGGALGDALANVLAAAGYRVEREYYINDSGSRMEAFNQSVYARCSQQLGRDLSVPADGYLGHYLIDVAREIVAEHGDSFLTQPPAEATRQIGAIGLEKMLASIRSTVDLMGISFDVWFSEQGLYDRDEVNATIALLRANGYVEKREGAVWFASSALGEDKDNVLVRSNGVPTYFASDIAYHRDKLVVRGFDRVVDIWGADHQGHVPRMRAGVLALDIPAERLSILVHQMITLRRGEEIVRISKRTGDIVTLQELLEEVGTDACRFFFLSRSADAQMDFDLELAKTQSNENPVYYVQYAHARIASILRYASGIDPADGDVSLLRHEAEMALIRKMLELPELVAMMAQNLEPHHLPHYAQDLAAVFHSFYTQCRVVSDDQELTRARLKLVLAARIVLARTLGLMGVSAPEQM